MCAQGPFQSAASSLVDEGAHPVEQLEVLAEKVADHEALGDTDAVIECRIKQLALHRLLLCLYDFPLQGLLRAEIMLAEAYAAGGYLKQADEHLTQVREVGGGNLYDDVQCQRLQVDILIAEGVVLLAKAKRHEKEASLSKEQHDVAHRTLTDAAGLARESYGDFDLRAARIQDMLGQIAQLRGQFADAFDHFSRAWEVQECVNGAFSEETLRLRLRMAEARYHDGKPDEAIDYQSSVVKELQQNSAFPSLLVDASARLARWYEAQSRDPEALVILQAAEKTVSENLGPENAKSVDIKSDIALYIVWSP
jgi:tetratricopeptide (TPR) repeat protein